MSVWIVIPAHGRERVSEVAFAGIRWTLDELARRGIDARALVVADDANLSLAAAHGFETLKRANRPLSGKWNDGYEHACRHGATHVMPCGSDDWLHPDLVEAMLPLSHPATVVACRQSSAIRPDGHELAAIRVTYEGGDGIRLFPTPLLRTVKYRPAAEKRDRAIDGSIQDRLRRAGRFAWAYVDLGFWQIVDFKTEHNLTGYQQLSDAFAESINSDPWRLLSRRYPDELVEAARGLYT